MSINGIVLAGGLSSRMGRDKALLPWQGRTLLEHMRGVLKQAGAGRVPGGGAGRVWEPISTSSVTFFFGFHRLSDFNVPAPHGNVRLNMCLPPAGSPSIHLDHDCK